VLLVFSETLGVVLEIGPVDLDLIFKVPLDLVQDLL
jgi:hypothetical protein